MTITWQAITEQQADTSKDINYETTSYLMPLIQLGVLQINGEDAGVFLQNLLTSNVNDLALNQSQLSGLCNPKGRLLAIFLLIHRPDCYQLVLPKTMVTFIQQRLTMFILRSKVTITDITPETAILGLTASNDGVDVLPFLPRDNYSGIDNKGFLVKIPGKVERYLSLSSFNEAEILCQTLLQHQFAVTQQTQWQLLDIAAGIPMIFPESKETFTPQQVNLDLIGGVSFKKGCYPGQEVVARLHYLGTPSRRMFKARCATQILPVAGQAVYDKENNTIGHVVCAEFESANSIKLLLSLKLSECGHKAYLDNQHIDDIIALADE